MDEDSLAKTELSDLIIDPRQSPRKNRCTIRSVIQARCSTSTYGIFRRNQKNRLTRCQDGAAFTAQCCFCSIKRHDQSQNSQPARTRDDGHPLQAGQGDCSRHPSEPSRSAKLLGGPGQTEGPRGEGPHSPRGAVTPLSLLPTVSPDRAKASALRHLLETFFDNSAEQAITALLDLKRTDLSSDRLDRLSETIERFLKDGK